jgi:shikimate dehydrogenase
LGYFDLIINATASSLSALSPLTDDQVKTLVQPNTVGYDMLYGQTTPFMQQIQDAGGKVIDGLGMLVEQAAEAFEIWRGNAVIGRLDTDAVIKVIKA